MNSIRARLVVGLIAGIVLVELIIGSVLYFVIQHAMWREYDASLAAKASSIASLVHIEDGKAELELSETFRGEFSKHEDASFFELFDAGGNVVAKSQSLGEKNLQRSSQRLFDLVLPDGEDGRAVAINLSPEVDKEETGKLPDLLRNMTLVVGTNSERLTNTLARIAIDLAIGGIAIAIISAGLVVVLVSRELRPVTALSRQARRVDATTLSMRFDEQLPAEMRPIALALNDLLARLEQAFERERRFTADVAHELRTPVAEIRTMCEVALMEEENARTLQRTVTDVHESARHMADLVERLMSLARCESGRELVDLRPIDLAEVVKRVKHSIDSQGREIVVTVSNPSLCRAEPAMVQGIVMNLISNAVEYSPPSSRVECEIAGCRLIVRNSQTKLSAADVEHVFEPFWRKDQARTSGAHAGIGLSLVAAYCRAMGVEVGARLNDEGDFEIEVVFQPPREDASPTNSGVSAGMRGERAKRVAK